jgi:transposase-like protein
MNYPEDLKQKMIKRMLPPNNEPISKIAREEGIAAWIHPNLRNR